MTGRAPRGERDGKKRRVGERWREREYMYFVNNKESLREKERGVKKGENIERKEKEITI